MDCSTSSPTDLVPEVPQSPCLLPGIFQPLLFLLVCSSLAFYLLPSVFIYMFKAQSWIYRHNHTGTSPCAWAQPVSHEDQQTAVHFSDMGRQICWAWPEKLEGCILNSLEHLPEALCVLWCLRCASGVSPAATQSHIRKQGVGRTNVPACSEI